jgi:hypothetical protein
MKLFKEIKYLINGKRKGQYELTTLDHHHCFFMDDTNGYECFPVKGTVIKPLKKAPVVRQDTFDDYMGCSEDDMSWDAHK